jgi:AI-2 transport protein TqsA
MPGANDRARQPAGPVAAPPLLPDALTHGEVIGLDPSPRSAAGGIVSLRSGGLGAAVVLFIAAVVIAGMTFAAELVSWIMLSIFFAILVRPLQMWLVRHRVPNALALLVVALIMLGVVFGLAALVGASVAQMVANAPAHRAQLADRLAELGTTLNSTGVPVPSRALTDVVNPSMLIDMFLSFLAAISGIVFNFFYMLLLVIFLLIDGPGMVARMRSGLGENHPLAVRLQAIGPKVVTYFGIRAYVNLLTGAGVAAGLWLLGIDYALLWGVLLFFFSFIPYIGIFLASIPPVLLALAEFGLPRALLVVVGITVINLMLENVVMPHMVGTSLSITPTVVLVSFFFWTGLLGGSGALLSVFMTMLVIVVLDSFELTRWIAGVMTESSSDTVDAAAPIPTDAATIDGKLSA